MKQVQVQLTIIADIVHKEWLGGSTFLSDGSSTLV